MNKTGAYLERINRVMDYIETHLEEKTMDDITIAYIRHTGSFSGNSRLFLELNRKLMDWAEPAGLVRYPDTRHIVVYHAPLGITPGEKLRMSVGITVSDEVRVNGEIGKMRISSGRYLFCRYTLKNNQYGPAWKEVYRYILPEGGLQPADGSCYEMYHHNCYDKRNQITTVEICVPVKKI